MIKIIAPKDKERKIGKRIDKNGTYVEEKVMYESSTDYYTYKFWDEGNYQIRELTREEEQKNIQIAKELIDNWEEDHLDEQLEFCIVKLLPNQDAHLLISHLKDE